jgi:hypothetical protein
MRYQFIVAGSVSEADAAELPELTCTTYPTGGTTLFGPVHDEADVLTMLARILDRGLAVIDMRPLPD